MFSVLTFAHDRNAIGFAWKYKKMKVKGQVGCGQLWEGGCVPDFMEIGDTSLKNKNVNLMMAQEEKSVRHRSVDSGGHECLDKYICSY